MSQPVIAAKVARDMKAASWIREMFEQGRRMKAEFGEQNVFDFTLGNPNCPPPDTFLDAVQAVAAERNAEAHRYMPNAGFDATRAAVADFLSSEYGIELDGASLIMTSGAAGGMNVALRAICNPGDEVIVLVPFFPEYRFYIEQASAVPVLVQTTDAFQPDVAAIEAAFTKRTRAVIVNSPNNPTGVVYSERACRAIAECLRRHDRAERPLYLLLDDPYRRLVYDARRGPSPIGDYERTLLISSFSKDVSIPGERVGYIAVKSNVPGRDQLLAAMTMLNRTLGFVNASAFMQRVLAKCAEALCDIEFYRRRRDLLCSMLRDCGYELTVPGGGMFAFPRTPIDDDAEFCQVLMRHKVLAVPGRGFGRAGYMRISFAVDEPVIKGARKGFAAAIQEATAAV